MSFTRVPSADGRICRDGRAYRARARLPKDLRVQDRIAELQAENLEDLDIDAEQLADGTIERIRAAYKGGTRGGFSAPLIGRLRSSV